MPDDRSRVSRRDLLRGVGAAAVLGSVTPALAKKPPADGVARLKGRTEITLSLNGKKTKVGVEPRTTLLDALRDRIGATGTKRVCDRGACGACTVWVDKQPVNSCLMLAVDADGAEVRTIEGLAQDGKLHPMQEAFVKADALQCGFCTPGMIMSAAALTDLQKVDVPEEWQVREAVSGNTCRCAAYVHIFEAIREGAGK